MAAPILERCSSGLRGTPGKRVYFKRVSGVRISFSPQQNEAQRNALGFFVQGRQELLLLRGLGKEKHEGRRPRASFCCKGPCGKQLEKRRTQCS